MIARKPKPEQQVEVTIHGGGPRGVQNWEWGAGGGAKVPSPPWGLERELPDVAIGHPFVEGQLAHPSRPPNLCCVCSQTLPPTRELYEIAFHPATEEGGLLVEPGL